MYLVDVDKDFSVVLVTTKPLKVAQVISLSYVIKYKISPWDRKKEKCTISYLPVCKYQQKPWLCSFKSFVRKKRDCN